MVIGTGTRLRLVFFGTPEFALPSLEALHASPHELVGVVTQPDQPSGRGQRPHPPPVKQAAVTANLPVLQPDRLADEGFIAQFAAWRPDLAVVAAYGKLFREPFLKLARLGFINVHASLLPRFRGAAPVQRAVIAGETATGVTIMRIVRALDAGPMLAAIRTPIGPEETAVQIEERLSTIGAALLLPAIDDLASGRAVETPQDESQATFAPRIEKAEGLIDWTKPARAIHNQVRGLHPWPRACTHLGHTRYLVHRTLVDAAEGRLGKPGDILGASGEGLSVAAGEGSLRILELQQEGRRILTAREFLAGHRLQPGETFGLPSGA
jgi:methionyl-tRNA formyltransferase